MALITSASKVYLGSTAISRIYRGATLLFDLIPPVAPYTPNLIYSDNRQLDATLPTGIDDPAMPVFVGIVAYIHRSPNITSADVLFKINNSASFSLRPLNDGRLQIGVQYFDTAAAASGETFAQSVDAYATNAIWNAIVAVASPADQVLEFWRYDNIADTMDLIRSEPIPSTAQINVDGLSLQLLDSTTKTNTYRVNSIALYKTATKPNMSDPSKFFDANGLIVHPDTTDAFLGGEAFARMSGDAASWNAGADQGYLGLTYAVTGGTPFNDVPLADGVPGYVAPEEPSGTGLVATTNTDTELLNATYLTPSSWSANEFDNADLATRLSLTVNRTSVMTGEAVYLKINGLTDEESALWGFFWEFDTSGEFQFLSGLPVHMRQKNRAAGHHQTAAWDTPGAKTVNVRVVPPAWVGIKGTELTVTVDNRDLDVEFSGRTWVVDTTGAFTDSPAGTQTTSLQVAINAVQSTAGGRVLLRRGQSVTFNPPDNVSKRFGVAGDTTMLGAWGPTTDPRPVLDVSNFGLDMRREVDNSPSVLFRDIDFRGGYDVATGNGARDIALSTNENNHITIHGCTFAGVTTAVTSAAGTAVNTGMLALYDSDVTAWEDYGFFIFSVQHFLARGSAVYQDPAAVNGYEAKEPGQQGNQPDHGPIRLANITNVVVSQIRGFSNNGWGDAGESTDGLALKPRAHQSFIRHGATSAEGCNSLINETWTESGGFGLQGGSSNRVYGSGLTVVTGNYILYTPNICGVGFGHSGIWFHNNLIVLPDQFQEQANPPSVFSFGSIAGGGVTDTWHTKPFRVFNNTIAYMISDANHAQPDKIKSRAELFGGAPPTDPTLTPNGAPEYIETNNVIWVPNATLLNEVGPLVPDSIRSAGVYGPAPLYEGKRQEQADGSVWFNAAYASKPDGAILPVLDPTSALDGTADITLAAATDFTGRACSADPAPGAIQPRALVEA